jgi:hypothetical protein
MIIALLNLKRISDSFETFPTLPPSRHGYSAHNAGDLLIEESVVLNPIKIRIPLKLFAL